MGMKVINIKEYPVLTRPGAPRFLLPVLLSASLVGATGSLLPQNPDRDGPNRDGDDEGRNRKILATFQEETRKTLIHEKKPSGPLQIELLAAPDAGRYQMMIGFQKLSKVSSIDQLFWQEVGSLYTRCKENQNKLFLRLTVSGGSNSFVEGSPRDLIRLESRAIKKVTILDAQPKLKYETWTIFESSRPRKKRLAPVKKLTLDILVTLKEDTDISVPLAISFWGVARQARRGDRHNSINPQQKQISCKSWRGLILPPVTFKLKKARWDVPKLPDGFEKLMEGLQG